MRLDHCFGVGDAVILAMIWLNLTMRIKGADIV